MASNRKGARRGVGERQDANADRDEDATSMHFVIWLIW